MTLTRRSAATMRHPSSRAVCNDALERVLDVLGDDGIGSRWDGQSTALALALAIDGIPNVHTHTHTHTHR